MGAEGCAVSTEEAAIPLAHSRRIQRHAHDAIMYEDQQQGKRQKCQRKSAARLARANVGKRTDARPGQQKKPEYARVGVRYITMTAVGRRPAWSTQNINARLF